jgi:hypothetical protein
MHAGKLSQSTVKRKRKLASPTTKATVGWERPSPSPGGSLSLPHLIPPGKRRALQVWRAAQGKAISLLQQEERPQNCPPHWQENHNANFEFIQSGEKLDLHREDNNSGDGGAGGGWNDASFFLCPVKPGHTVVDTQGWEGDLHLVYYRSQKVYHSAPFLIQGYSAGRKEILAGWLWFKAGLPYPRVFTLNYRAYTSLVSGLLFTDCATLGKYFNLFKSILSRTDGNNQILVFKKTHQKIFLNFLFFPKIWDSSLELHF